MIKSLKSATTILLKASAAGALLVCISGAAHANTIEAGTIGENEVEIQEGTEVSIPGSGNETGNGTGVKGDDTKGGGQVAEGQESDRDNCIASGKCNESGQQNSDIKELDAAEELEAIKSGWSN